MPGDSYPTDQELIGLLLSEEDNFVERKSEGIKDQEVRKTLVAFANTIPEGNFAEIFFGVTDEGGKKGVSNTDRLQKKIKKIAEDCYPPIDYSVRAIEHEGKDYLAVIIPHSTQKPHFAGGCYVRVGSESVQATQAKYDELIATRNSKAYAIIQMKNKGVVLENSQYKMQLPSGLVVGYTFAEIMDCDAHRVKIRFADNDRYHTFPLEDVVVSYNDHFMKNMLIIKNR